MNINGRNGLACLTDIDSFPEGKPIVLRPLPGLPVIRDLIVDMTQFFKQYHSIKPYLINNDPPPERERLQSPEDREELNGLYECILCACCSTSCPSFWWNPDKFVGPAGLLAAYRFIADTRDQATSERLDNLEDPYRLFRCHTIMNCVDVCPKGLNPTKAIGKIKDMMVQPGGVTMDETRRARRGKAALALPARAAGTGPGLPALLGSGSATVSASRMKRPLRGCWQWKTTTCGIW